MNLTDDQKIEIVCAALRGVLVAKPDQIEAFPAKIAESAVEIAQLIVVALEKVRL